MTTTTAPAHARLLLPLALKLDAAVTAVNGAAYLVAAPVLDDLLGLPAGPMRAVGAFLLVFGAAVWAVGARPRVPTQAAAAVIAVNGLWVAGSVVAAVTGLGSPSGLGTTWIALQAAVVAAFAALQTAGLRRLS